MFALRRANQNPFRSWSDFTTIWGYSQQTEVFPFQVQISRNELGLLTPCKGKRDWALPFLEKQLVEPKNGFSFHQA